MNVSELFTQAKVVAVVRKIPRESFLDVMDALVNGGIRAIEITMDSTDAASGIADLNRRYGDQVVVGAGTVFAKEQVREAVDAGAKFLVCPHLDVSLIEQSLKLNCPLVPGVFTPTEIHTALAAGAEVVKVFPASSLGASFVRDVLGPFAGLQMMVTGGLNVNNFLDFLQAGAIAVGMGSSLFPRADIEMKNWSAITKKAKQLLSLST
ncbi:bifunctional 4-hydroxy-2-oxoglutarate aldolase/2-dehydro-3-deoxy-phosphogluconate aldolase [Alicyclobacillaceae bacterium I2511]|nr:bifunctional 4-hydroxy-2-oxoglutarate aldolase/2-dehydro-3-deoxy-phosphogluconate aldolase [Alicyclobacillaceae bacterium I2511]